MSPGFVICDLDAPCCTGRTFDAKVSHFVFIESCLKMAFRSSFNECTSMSGLSFNNQGLKIPVVASSNVIK